MEGCPVTIRYLDPPLHEFLPTEEKDIQSISAELGITAAELKEVEAEINGEVSLYADSEFVESDAFQVLDDVTEA